MTDMTDMEWYRSLPTDEQDIIDDMIRDFKKLGVVRDIALSYIRKILTDETEVSE